MAQDKTSTPVNSQKKAMDLYLAAKAMEAAERDFGKTYIEPLGPGKEITRPDNFLYNALSNPRLNRGLSNIGEAFIGEGTGSLAGDLLAGLAGGGAGIVTELAGGNSGAIDWIPGGSVMKAGLFGLVQAGKAAREIVLNGRFRNEWPGRAKFRHQGTNYDSKSRKYGEDIAWNARTGNLPTDTRKILLRTATSSAGNRLPGQMTGIMDGKDLYDELFRKKVDRKIRELDNRYVVDFLGY